MKPKFNIPQRQSPVGMVIMFIDTMQRFLRSWWIPLAILIYKMPPLARIFLALGTVGIFVLIGIVAFLRYWNFTFFIDENKLEFVVQSGILSKKRLSIGLDKIQQVNINQNFIQKIIGVYSLEVETAGSGTKEVKIKAIDHHSAQILKEKLLEKDTVFQTIQDLQTSQEQEKRLVKVSLLSLLKVGITSDYRQSLAILLSFFLMVYERMKGFVQNEILTEEQIEYYFAQGTKSVFWILFFGFFLVIFVINLIRTVIKYFDLEILKDHSSLLISYGFFAKKNTLLNPKKTQIVWYSQNFFQRKMNVFKLKIKQASSNQINENNKKNESSSIEILGINRSEKDEILHLIYEKITTQGTIFKPNYRFLFRGFYFGILLPVSLFLICGFFADKMLKIYFPYLFLYVLVAGIFIYFRYLNHRLFVNSDFIIKKNGAWDVEHQIIEPYKIQAITTKQYFWHKRSDVGHVILHTAGGNLYFYFADFSQINQQINYWLYQVATSNKSFF